MKIKAARWEAGNLILSVENPAEAIRFAYRFEAGEYEILKAKRRRSLDANAYAWVLIDKIAAAVNVSKTEIYKNTIKEIGGNSQIVCVSAEAADEFCRGWRHNGLGWQTESFPSVIEGYINVVLYYGSSCYDTRQMSIFIDRLIQDAQALGIETMPPDRLNALLEAWHGA